MITKRKFANRTISPTLFAVMSLFAGLVYANNTDPTLTLKVNNQGDSMSLMFQQEYNLKVNPNLPASLDKNGIFTVKLIPEKIQATKVFTVVYQMANARGLCKISYCDPERAGQCDTVGYKPGLATIPYGGVACSVKSSGNTYYVVIEKYSKN